MDLQALARNLSDLILPWIARVIYAAGTFTPTWIGTTTAGSYTYTAGDTYGEYVRIFDLVYVNLRMAITAIGVAPVGNMRITGMSALPVPKSGRQHALTIGYLSNCNLQASALGLTAWMLNDSSEARIGLRHVFDNAGSNQFADAQFTNANIDILISGWYRTE